MLYFVYWNIHPNVPLPFDFFSMQWYGVMWMLSILSSFYIGRIILKNELDLNHADQRASKPNLWTEHEIILLIEYVFIGAILGARLGHVFFYQWEMYAADPIQILQVWKGGLASHGGVIGGIVSIFLFQYIYKKKSILWILDTAALILYLPCSLIRLGNLFNSELIGKVTDVPWAFIFKLVDNQPRHAVVLYEAIAYFVLFIIVALLFKKYGRLWDGFYTALFFCLVFSVRFLLEFFKEADGFVFFNISKTQWLSVPFILIGLFLILINQKEKRIHE